MNISDGGTEHTVSKSLGISKVAACAIVDAYHELYKGVTIYYDKWVKEAIKNKGIGKTPHGLIIRTQELLSPEQHIAESAERSYTNALIQGFSGQLMVKAINRIVDKIEELGLENDIIPFLTIHDAVYVYVRNNPETIKIANEIIVSIMVEDYKEDQLVHNLAELDVGYSWKQQVTLKNNATLEEVKEFLEELQSETKEDK